MKKLLLVCLLALVGCDKQWARMSVRQKYPEADIWVTRDHTFIVRNPDGAVIYCECSGSGQGELPDCVEVFKPIK